jgi:hypothetical protein
MIARIKSDDGLVSILLIYEVPFFLSLYCFIALLLAFFLKVNRCLSNYSAFIFSNSSIILWNNGMLEGWEMTGKKIK